MHLSNYYCNNGFDENLLFPTQLDYDLMTGYDSSLTDFTEMDQIKPYKNVNVENWSPFNVFDWIAETACDNGWNYNTFNARGFNHIDGRSLEKMTPENCINLTGSREVGVKLFQAKQNLFDGILSMERMTQEEFYNSGNSLQTAPNNYLPPEQQHLDSSQLPTVVTNPVSNTKVKTNKGPGRPRKEPKDENKIRHKPYGKIWEFIDKLLSDKDTCPSLIKWDDYKTGTFKFVQPKKVAQLWGLRKNNSKMDYNKFTRALRYHYKKGYLNSVEEKRLVYKFGPKAIALRNKTQNIS